MKVGFVLECHFEGADHKVIDHLVRALHPGIEAHFSCSGSKRLLFEQCGTAVKRLFDTDRCERVFVVWDLVPCDDVFKDKGIPSRRKERLHLRSVLREKDCERTIMLCIRHELEAWLLTDGKALTAVIANKNHPKKPIADDKQPENHPNPKKRLTKIFKDHGRGEYADAVHAIKIIKAVNLSKLERAPSYAHFKKKLDALQEGRTSRHKVSR